MNQNFQTYNAAVRDAFVSLIKTDDIISRKTESFLKILKNKGEIKTVLHCGFGPVAIGLAKEGYKVSLMDSSLVPAEYADLFVETDFNSRFDAVIALDEYLTFANDEDEQKEMILNICDLTKEILIVTLSDYKNMPESNKEYSEPQGYKTKDGYVTYLEKNTRGRNFFTTKVYKIDEKDELTVYGAINRRMLFFKQLARQAEDNKSVSFNFQKNLMYKGMLKKNYEHIIAINFS